MAISSETHNNDRYIKRTTLIIFTGFDAYVTVGTFTCLTMSNQICFPFVFISEQIKIRWVRRRVSKTGKQNP